VDVLIILYEMTSADDMDDALLVCSSMCALCGVCSCYVFVRYSQKSRL